MAGGGFPQLGSDCDLLRREHMRHLNNIPQILFDFLNRSEQAGENAKNQTSCKPSGSFRASGWKGEAKALAKIRSGG